MNTPQIFKINEERKLYIQEFLGEKTLSEIITLERESERVKSLVKKTLEHLFELQEKTQNNNPIFLKFVFMISSFYKSELIVVSWFSDLVVNSIFTFLYQFRFDIVTLGLKFI